MPLSDEQQAALETLESGCNTFLTGDAGTGKTYVVDAFVERARKAGRNVAVCAPTGIAALNAGGTTIHRLIGAKAAIQPKEPPKTIPAAIKAADVVVVDEVSMCRADLFEALCSVIMAENDARKSGARARSKYRKPRGSRLQLVVVGDYAQLPPVLTSRDAPAYRALWGEEVFAFGAQAWDLMDFEGVLLTEQHRQSDKEFLVALDLCRHGDAAGLKWVCDHASQTRFDDAVTLCAARSTVDKINEAALAELDGETVTSDAYKTGRVADSERPCDEHMTLKIGCRLMILTNDPDGRYVNGTCGTLLDETVSAKGDPLLVIQCDDGETVEVGRHSFEFLDARATTKKDGTVALEQAVIGSFEQFPVRLNYACTIHKAQGLTFDRLNVRPWCWEGAHGMLYTALSRVRSVEGLHIEGQAKSSYLFCDQRVEDLYRTLGTGTVNAGPRVVYLSGPDASAFPTLRRAKAAFKAAAKEVLSVWPDAQVYDPVAEVGPNATGEERMRACAAELLTLGGRDLVVQLPGWEQSSAAQCEAALAAQINVPVRPLDEVC